jgi:hypothetical protein
MGRLSTVGLLFKVACFLNKVNNISNEKVSKYKEVKCTEPSPSFRLPWMGGHALQLVYDPTLKLLQFLKPFLDLITYLLALIISQGPMP